MLFLPWKASFMISCPGVTLIFIGTLVLSCCSSICFRHGRDLILTWVVHTKLVTVLSGSKHSPCHLLGVDTFKWYSRSDFDVSNNMDDKETCRSFHHFGKIENMLSSSLLSLSFVTEIYASCLETFLIYSTKFCVMFWIDSWMAPIYGQEILVKVSATTSIIHILGG